MVCTKQKAVFSALIWLGTPLYALKGAEMTVFHIAKNTNYTVMSNHHLRNRELSLKAKGLLSQMLSLPDGYVLLV